MNDHLDCISSFACSHFDNQSLFINFVTSFRNRFVFQVKIRYFF